MTKNNKEERIEKIIRGLLILPENRRCITCNSLTDKEESGENRSPNYEDRHGWSERSGFSGRAGDKTIKYYHDERSPRYYSQENARCGGFMKSPVHFDVVDERPSSVHPFAYRESRFGNKVSDIQKDMHQSGSNAPMAGEHSKTANRKDADGSAHNQLMPPSSSPMESAGGNPVQQKSHNSGSSVDLNANSKSSDATAAPPAQENLLSVKVATAPHMNPLERRTPFQPQNQILWNFY
ncbi:ADP-ribosylation factor GTPase-activating protein [Salix suchowensis]|nr:ADP-ribosylation factor GTPase-activating protein [Salix suchowensis]